MKQYILQALPPKLFLLLKGYGWYGNFKTWKEAEQLTGGYDSKNIIEKVNASLLKVKNGEAIYERDSVIFDEVEYSWELLTALLWVAAQYRGILNIIDFGGSLGSTYYQNKKFLEQLPQLKWNIVEQPSFIEKGKQNFENEILAFYSSVAEVLTSAKEPVNCILFSSVLQYLEKPYDQLKEVFSYKIPFIIIDRTGFTLNNSDRITIQKVPSSIYTATYPCWFFNEEKFVSTFINNGYELIMDFNSLDKTNIPSIYKGYIFKLKVDA